MTGADSSKFPGSRLRSGRRQDAGHIQRQACTWRSEIHEVSKALRGVLHFASRLIDCRGTFDFFARYKHVEIPADVLAMKPIPVEKLRAEGKLLTVNQWMMRIILLESFAGCPGMVAGTLRHLRSLRLLVCIATVLPRSAPARH